MILSKPVLLITFNRPETTRQVLSAIRKAGPKKLYVFSDAPRRNTPSDIQKVKEVRSLFNELDWDSELHLKFEENNLGCARGVTSAINWIFENEEDAIILEDDCLPDLSFFIFCEQMLDKYAKSSKVMHIAGTRWNSEFKTDSSYLFSSIGHVWGWATWKRAWLKYDYEMNDWESNKIKIREALGNTLYVAFWTELFRNIASASHKHTWDYQWQYTLFKESGLSLVPDVNLISNIGVVGVHSNYSNNLSDASNYTHQTALHNWKFISEPNEIGQNRMYDLYHMENHFLRFFNRFKKLKKLVKYYVGR